MLVQRAIFTSLQTDRNEGYQLAAASPDILPDEIRELAQWGPGHDSVYEFAAARRVTSMHRLQSGAYCLALTCGVGNEYSGRGGMRIYTWFFLLPERLFQRFAFQPFRLMQALAAAGHADIIEPTINRLAINRLDPIVLVGRASSVDAENLAKVCNAVGALRLATLLNAALTTARLGIVTNLRTQPLFTALLDLLPPAERTAFPLTTGLRVSSRRPYRIHALPHDAAKQRAATRRLPLTVFSLLDDPDGQFAPQNGWALHMYRFLKDKKYDAVAQIADGLREKPVDNLDCLAELECVRHS